MADLHGHLQHLLPPAPQLSGTSDPTRFVAAVGMAAGARNTGFRHAKVARQVRPGGAHHAKASEFYGCNCVERHLRPFDRPQERVARDGQDARVCQVD